MLILVFTMGLGLQYQNPPVFATVADEPASSDSPEAGSGESPDAFRDRFD